MSTIQLEGFLLLVLEGSEKRRTKGYFANRCVMGLCKCPSVLIVDDNNVNRFALRLILKLVGREDVEEACDGQEAVDKVVARSIKNTRRAFKVIFMDINMPIKDGYTATEEIRTHVGRDRTIIVGTSAYP